MQISSTDLKPLLYLTNLLNDLLQQPQKYSVTADEVRELHAAADTINRIVHRVRGITEGHSSQLGRQS
jgi:hypothetical protein